MIVHPSRLCTKSVSRQCLHICKAATWQREVQFSGLPRLGGGKLDGAGLEI